jgi:hypothetical protein
MKSNSLNFISTSSHARFLVHRIYLSDFHVKHKFPWEGFPLFGKDPILVPLFEKEGQGRFSERCTIQIWTLW